MDLFGGDLTQELEDFRKMISELPKSNPGDALPEPTKNKLRRYSSSLVFMNRLLTSENREQASYVMGLLDGLEAAEAEPDQAVLPEVTALGTTLAPCGSTATPTVALRGEDSDICAPYTSPVIALPPVCPGTSGIAYTTDVTLAHTMTSCTHTPIVSSGVSCAQAITCASAAMAIPAKTAPAPVATLKFNGDFDASTF
jgi:hypothetical protein